MRNRMLFAGCILAAATALVWLWMNRDTLSAPLTPAPQASIGGASATATFPPSVTVASPPPSPATYEDQQKAFVAAFNTPINFYGRVIDQYGDPVAGADVKLSANDKASGGRPSEISVTTDADGHFSIVGIVGITLAVEISKPGYRNVPRTTERAGSSGLFEYGLSSRGSHESSPAARAIFALQKIGTLDRL